MSNIAPGPEVDVGQREQRDVVVERGGRVGRVAPAQLEVEQVRATPAATYPSVGNVVGSSTTHPPVRAAAGGGDEAS